MTSLRSSAALTNSSQIFHVASGKDAMMALAQNGANAVHNHEISPLIHRAASELIARDDKGQKTDITAVGFPHIVLQDVARELAALGVSAFTSAQILEALQSYTVGLGAEFAREAQAKPLYARIVVTDKKPDDLLDCELVQATLIDGERRIGDALGQRVMQSTIYGTRTSMTRDMSVEEMLASSQKKMLMIYYGSPSGQDVQGFDNVELNLIHMVAGLGGVLPDSEQRALQAAITANPHDPRIAEILRGFSDVQTLLQPTRGEDISVRGLSATTRGELARTLEKIHSGLAGLAKQPIVMPLSISQGEKAFPPEVLAILTTQLQDMAHAQNISLGVSPVTSFATPANDDVFGPENYLPAPMLDNVLVDIADVVRQLPLQEQEKFAQLIAQANGVEGKDDVTLKTSALDQITALLVNAATHELIAPQAYASIAKILPDIVVVKAEMRAVEARAASAPADILAVLTEVRDALSVAEASANTANMQPLPQKLQEIKSALNVIVQTLTQTSGVQEKGQPILTPHEKIAAALQALEITGSQSSTPATLALASLGMQVQGMLTTLTQPHVQESMAQILKPKGENATAVLPDVARGASDISRAIETLQNLPRQYPQVMEAALCTTILQSLPPSSASTEKLGAVRTQGIAGIAQAIHEGIFPASVVSSLIAPYVQHNPAMMDHITARMIINSPTQHMGVTQADAAGLRQIANLVETKGYESLQSPVVQKVIESLSPAAQTALQSTVQRIAEVSSVNVTTLPSSAVPSQSTILPTPTIQKDTSLSLDTAVKGVDTIGVSPTTILAAQTAPSAAAAPPPFQPITGESSLPSGQGNGTGNPTQYHQKIAMEPIPSSAQASVTIQTAPATPLHSVVRSIDTVDAATVLAQTVQTAPSPDSIRHGYGTMQDGSVPVAQLPRDGYETSLQNIASRIVVTPLSSFDVSGIGQKDIPLQSNDVQILSSSADNVTSAREDKNHYNPPALSPSDKGQASAEIVSSIPSSPEPDAPKGHVPEISAFSLKEGAKQGDTPPLPTPPIVSQAETPAPLESAPVIPLQPDSQVEWQVDITGPDIMGHEDTYPSTENQVFIEDDTICTGGPNCKKCKAIFDIASAGKALQSEISSSPTSITNEFECCAKGTCPAHAAAAISNNSDEFNGEKMELGF